MDFALIQLLYTFVVCLNLSYTLCTKISHELLNWFIFSKGMFLFFQDPSLWRHALSMASESNDTPLNRGPTQVALSSANRVASAEAVV